VHTSAPDPRPQPPHPTRRSSDLTSQVTRHICVEGWSAIGKWSGVRFSDFLARVGADTSAKYIGFKCADDYYTSLDMATALHPQTDRKSTRLNSSHQIISYAVFCF